MRLIVSKETSFENLKPINFQEEFTTVWSFPERGSWATHLGDYRGNWPPEVPGNLILKYSKAGQIVLDNFSGSGTTAIEARVLSRRCVAIDINEGAVKLTKKNLLFKVPFKHDYKPRVLQGDARDLSTIPDKQIDLICSHPPYANAIGYSKNTPGDLSLLDMQPFLQAMLAVAKESYRVLKRGGHCAVQIGDLRQNKRVRPLGFEVMKVYQAAGFNLKEIILKEQHNCTMTDKWKERALKYGFLLLMHEYIFVFDK